MKKSKTLKDYYNLTAKKESSDNYKIPITSKNPNPEFRGKYLGRYQMGVQALEEAGYYKRSDEEKRITQIFGTEHLLVKTIHVQYMII